MRPLDFENNRIDQYECHEYAADAVEANSEALTLRSADTNPPLDGTTTYSTLASLLSERNARIAQSNPKRAAGPSAFVRNRDGAPRLFGTDLRLRNMMALAKYGALHAAELARMVPVVESRAIEETRSHAPFGRGATVRTWETKHGMAAELDPAHPVAVPLRRLLLKMEERYPLPPFAPVHEKPESPPLVPWRGDRLAFFGSPIPTSILMTIGVLGWTFEALCCETATGYDRAVVKKALKRLEVEGIVEGSRERRPGFNVRVIKLAKSFHAREELDALLKACVEAWPMYADSVNKAMKHLQPRTREHLQRRGIVERDPWGPAKPGRDLAAIELARRKERLLRDYRQLEKALGKTPTSNDVVAFSGRVSKGIRDCWGGFRQFCAENNIAPDYRHAQRAIPNSNADVYQAGPKRRVRRRRKITPEDELRARQRDCIVRYRRLVAQQGRDLTSAEINGKFDSNLYRSIRALWPTFADFRTAAGLTDKRRGAVMQPNVEERQRCIAEYVALGAEFNGPLNSAALAKHRPYLLNRIKWQWGSFADFSLEMRLPLKRHRNQHLSDEVKRERCMAEYRALSLRLGRRPASHELQALTDGLYKRIRRLWGGFAAFRKHLGC